MSTTFTLSPDNQQKIIHSFHTQFRRLLQEYVQSTPLTVVQLCRIKLQLALIRNDLTYLLNHKELLLDDCIMRELERFGRMVDHIQYTRFPAMGARRRFNPQGLHIVSSRPTSIPISKVA